MSPENLENTTNFEGWGLTLVANKKSVNDEKMVIIKLQNVSLKLASKWGLFSELENKLHNSKARNNKT